MSWELTPPGTSGFGSWMPGRCAPSIVGALLGRPCRFPVPWKLSRPRVGTKSTHGEAQGQRERSVRGGPRQKALHKAPLMTEPGAAAQDPVR